MRSISKDLFVNYKEFIPDLDLNMFNKGESGVRAQLMDISGKLFKTLIFYIIKLYSNLKCTNPAALL